MDFDAEKFIAAVKERPVLWDLASDEYANRQKKKTMWEETTLLFGGTELATPEEKNKLCLSLQKKWRNIKDSYNRERRRIHGAKSGSAATRKSPYVYYNLLSFLNSTTPPTSTQSSIQSIEAADIETNEDNEKTVAGPYETRVLAKKKKPQDDVGKELIAVLKESSAARQKRDNAMLEDEDRLFMLSLVSDFKKVPQHLKLYVKRQFLKVLEDSQLPPSQYQTTSHSTQGYYTQPPQTNLLSFDYNTGCQQDYSTRSQDPSCSTPHSTAGSCTSADGSPLYSCFEDL